MLQEKQFFLEQLKDGPLALRKIANRMKRRFGASPASIKDVLLLEGFIVLSHTQREGAMQKINHYFMLTGKKMAVPKPKIAVYSDTWEDGTVKSKGNAFDLSRKESTMFNKHEIAQMRQKYNNHQITTYSRA
jgi:hypothetical protein